MTSEAIRGPFEVVVGVDGSASGRGALRWAVDEARARHGRVTVVHAWTTPYDWQMEVLVPPDVDALRAAAQRRLDDTVAAVEHAGVPTDPVLVEGDPREVLLAYARGSDLLVVGSHGHGRVAEMLLGSVSSYCAHHAPVPVVIVRPRPTD